jgi:flavodoxin
MRTLVIYYSKTGNTRSVAERIARATSGDLEEIVEAGKRGGNLRSAFDATLGRRPAVKPFTRSLDGYDLVFVGTPIWKMTAVPAMHVFLPSQDWTNRSVALFCTTAVVGTQRGLAAMKEQLPGACVVGELALDGAALKDEGAVDSRVSAWIAEVCAQIPA